MIAEVEQRDDATAYVKELLDDGERLMGFGHRVYRAEDPRARVLRRTAKELGAPRYEVAAALEPLPPLVPSECASGASMPGAPGAPVCWMSSACEIPAKASEMARPKAETRRARRMRETFSSWRMG